MAVTHFFHKDWLDGPWAGVVPSRTFEKLNVYAVAMHFPQPGHDDEQADSGGSYAVLCTPNITSNAIIACGSGKRLDYDGMPGDRMVSR